MKHERLQRRDLEEIDDAHGGDDGQLAFVRERGPCWRWRWKWVRSDVGRHVVLWEEETRRVDDDEVDGEASPRWHGQAAIDDIKNDVK
jgi:hypothetical protein